MPKGEDNLRGNKKEERSLLARVVYFAPLLSLVIRAIEFVLKLLGLLK